MMSDRFSENGNGNGDIREMRNVLKCSTLHTFFTVKFCHFSSAAFIEKKRRTGTYASSL